MDSTCASQEALCESLSVELAEDLTKGVMAMDAIQKIEDDTQPGLLLHPECPCRFPVVSTTRGHQRSHDSWI